MPDEEAEDVDATERLRVALLGLGLGLNLALIYWQWKDTAEGIAIRARCRQWWDHNISGPRRRLKELRRADRRVLFEAIQTVEGKL